MTPQEIKGGSGMEVIKWANGQGQKLILSQEEAEDLQKALEIALHYGKCEDGDFFEIEIERS